MIRVVLVDDEPSVRQGLKMRLGLTKEMSVVGETGDGESALELIRELAPDVVVMDVELPGRDGISVTQSMRVQAPCPAVVILSIHDDPETRARASQAGAARFVSKHEKTEVLLDAIQDAMAPAQRVDAEESEK